MYYIQTADRLTRTSVWLEKMEGGIDYLRDVIVNDRLGIADELERQMQSLVDTLRVRMEGGRRRSGEAAVLPAVRQHRRDRAERRVRDRAGPAAARRLADGLRAARPPRAAATDRAGRRDRTGSRRWVQRRVGVTDFPVDGGRADQVRPDPDRRLPLRQPRRVVRLPEHLSAQAGDGPVARHPRRSAGRPQGRLPAAQEDVLARVGRVPERRAITRSRSSRCKVEGDDVFVELPPEEELEAPRWLDVPVRATAPFACA